MKIVSGAKVKVLYGFCKIFVFETMFILENFINQSELNLWCVKNIIAEYINNILSSFNLA